MKRKGILEISDQYLSYKDVVSKGIINNKQIDSFEIKAKNLEEIKVDFKNKKLFLIIHGEEVYVKHMTLPKVNKNKLYFLIKDELRYKFKKIDNIMFTYEVTKDKGRNVEVIVFCLNWNKSDLISKCVEKGAEIEGIYPIQFHVFNNYRKRIKDANYIFIFIMQNNLYFVACSGNEIIGDSVCKMIDFNNEMFIDELEKFKMRCCNLRNAKDFYNLYFLDFPHKDLIENISVQYKCTNLGIIDKGKLQV